LAVAPAAFAPGAPIRGERLVVLSIGVDTAASHSDSAPRPRARQRNDLDPNRRTQTGPTAKRYKSCAVYTTFKANTRKRMVPASTRC